MISLYNINNNNYYDNNNNFTFYITNMQALLYALKISLYFGELYPRH